MKLAIVAATGGIGRLMLEQAVAAGHDVTAVVRNPANLSVPVRAIKVDLSRPDSRQWTVPTPYCRGSVRGCRPRRASPPAAPVPSSGR